MGQAIDLTGQVFGRLTVLERDGYYVSPRGARHINWLVRCSCADVITHATTSQLRRKGNPVQSCGCLRRETNRERLLIDLTGARFGKLTVVRRLGTKTFPGGATQPLWQAQCEYGQVVTVVGVHLRTGHTTSCGKLCQSIEVPTYSAVHNRIRRARGKASDHMCVRCNMVVANDWCYNWAGDIEITDEEGRTYSADIMDYDPRCWTCHRSFDNLMSLFDRWG